MKRSLVVISSMIILSACAQEPKEIKQAAPSSKSTDSGTMTISSGEAAQANLSFDAAEVRRLPQRIELAATVQPDEVLTMPVSSLVPGRAEEVNVRLGDTVSKGQLLATIRSDEIAGIEADFLQKLLEMRAEHKQKLLELQSEVAQLSTKVDYLGKQSQRRKFLTENKIGSKAELESAQSELGQAQSALQAAIAKEAAEREAAAAKESSVFISAKEKIRIYGLSDSEIDRVAQKKSVKSIFQIRAPKAGIITTRDVDPGETVDANKHLFVITDLSRVWFIGQIFEKDLRTLSLNMPVKCSVNSYPGEQFNGRLEFMGSKLDPQTRTLPIRASVANPERRLKPDMFGHILITFGYVQALTVPKEALQTIGEMQVVFVKQGSDRFERRKVTPGNEIDNYVEILKGLKSGEQVVTSGSIDLLGKTLQSLKQ